MCSFKRPFIGESLPVSSLTPGCHLEDNQQGAWSATTRDRLSLHLNRWQVASQGTRPMSVYLRHPSHWGHRSTGLKPQRRARPNATDDQAVALPRPRFLRRWQRWWVPWSRWVLQFNLPQRHLKGKEARFVSEADQEEHTKRSRTRFLQPARFWQADKKWSHTKFVKG